MTRHARFAFLLVASAWLAVCNLAPAGARKEPDAKPVVIDGALGNADAKDKQLKDRPAKVHAVHLDKGVAYVIDLASKSFDAYLRIEDPAGKPIAEDDDGAGGTNARLFFIPAKSGDYKLIATSFTRKTGPYRLTVQRSNLQPSALKLEDSAKVEGRLIANGPRSPFSPHNNCQLYRVELKAGTTYVIDLASTDFDAYLALADARLVRIASDDDSGGKLNARLRYECSHDGTFYIVAAGLGNPTGAFTLAIRKAD